MALDKVVDSAQLDADLTAVADAIRDRAGTSEPLVFPDGFVGAVEGIPDYARVVEYQALTSFSSDKVTSAIREYSFYNLNTLETVSLPNATRVEYQAFMLCKALKNVYLPKVDLLAGGAFRGCSALEVLDLPSVSMSIGDSCFRSSGLKTLILRHNAVVKLASTSAFDLTVFAQGGTGGTVYIPASQISAYQTDTNWSALYAAGTCNFVAIEGSEYE